MSRSSVVCGGTLTSEQQLMQLADDPLLVRDFIQRNLHLGPVAETGLITSGVSAIALAKTAAQCQPGGARGPSVLRQYDSPVAEAEGSTFPSAFVATAQDRREALDHDVCLTEEGPQEGGAARMRRACAIAIAVLVLICLLGVQG